MNNEVIKLNLEKMFGLETGLDQDLAKMQLEETEIQANVKVKDDLRE